MSPTRWLRVLVAVLGLGSALILLLLAAVDPKGSTWALVWVAYALMGAWVLWHQTSNRIGWFLLSIALIFTLVTLINWYVTHGWGPGPVAIELISSVLGGIGWLAFLLMVTLFPDGVAVGWLQRWLARFGWLGMALAVLLIISPNALPDTARLGPFAGTAVGDIGGKLAQVGGVLLALYPFLVLLSLVPRWRAADGLHRQQFKWFFWGAAITVVVLAIGSNVSDSVGPEVIAYGVWVVGGAALPVSIAIAVQRYRLYDIDRVISRTTSYAIVTGLLAALFAVVVALGSSVLGSQNQLAVAAATLLTAAVARPLYRKVQRLVDRRFDRARYDGRLTVDAFGQRLSHEVDTDTVAHDLENTVNAALAPATISLWTKEHA